MMLLWCFHLLASLGDQQVVGLRPGYKWLNLNRLCSSLPGKNIIQLHPRDSLILTYRKSPAHQIKCHLRLRLPADKFGFSVFMEEMKLGTLTEKNQECDSDFIQFGR